MPVGNASNGVGLFAGQIMLTLNMNMQQIEWSHDFDLEGADDFNHFGTLDSYLLIPTITIGLSDYWNFNYTQVIGVRSMGWGPDQETIHHRTETSLEDFTNAKGGAFGDAKLKFRYLMNNVGMQPGNRFFIGFGLSVPSDNTLTSDPFFLEEAENGPIDWDDEEEDYNHRHFALSDGTYKGVIELQFFKKQMSNPVFYGLSTNIEIPFDESQYTDTDQKYTAGNNYNITTSALFSITSKNQYAPIGITGGLSFLKTEQAFWNDLPDPTSKSTIVVPSVGVIWKTKQGSVSINIQKPIFIEGVGMGSDNDNNLNNQFDAIEVVFGYRYTLDYVIPWLYF